MRKPNHYDTLGVTKEASPEEIKKSFRKLATEHHPDKGGDAEKFKEINEAYSTLSDPDKKRAYDGVGGGFDGNIFNMSGFDMGDFFNMHFNGGGVGQRSAASRRGADLKANIEITLYEMLVGCNKEVSITFTESCKACQGTGAAEKTDCGRCQGTGRLSQQMATGMGMQIRTGPCPDCKGTGFHIVKTCPACEFGRVVSNKKVDVQIPPRVGYSGTLRLSGQGTAGFYGGPSGDLFVHMSVAMPDVSTLSQEELELLKGI